MRIPNHKLLREFRRKFWCEHCGKTGPVDPHHLVIKRGMGGGRRLDLRINLIALCRFPCHIDAESCLLPQCTLLAIVARREGVLAHHIEPALRAILGLPKGTSREVWEALLPKRLDEMRAIIHF